MKLKSKTMTSIQNRLENWFDIHQRKLPWRDSKNPYFIWVSEVMLQQTQVVAVVPYYHRFLKRFPDIFTLARSDLQDVLKLWEGLGYYARARNLHKAAGVVVQQYDGRIPDDPETFRTLPGVGDYIGAAVSSIAFGHPLAVVDGNVKRVLARLFLLNTPVNGSTKDYRIFKNMADDLLDHARPGMFNQAVMELGALICKPGTPDCRICPLETLCRARQEHQTGQYPVRIKKQPIPEYRMVVGVIRKKQKFLIAKRKDQGLLGGLWEFPSGRIENGEESAKVCIREMKTMLNLDVTSDSFLIRAKHAYTHFKIIMDVFLLKFTSGHVILNGPDAYEWITVKEIEKYPFTGASHKFIPYLIHGMGKSHHET